MVPPASLAVEAFGAGWDRCGSLACLVLFAETQGANEEARDLPLACLGCYAASLHGNDHEEARKLAESKGQFTDSTQLPARTNTGDFEIQGRATRQIVPLPELLADFAFVDTTRGVLGLSGIAPAHHSLQGGNES